MVSWCKVADCNWIDVADSDSSSQVCLRCGKIRIKPLVGDVIPFERSSKNVHESKQTRGCEPVQSQAS